MFQTRNDEIDISVPCKRGIAAVVIKSGKGSIPQYMEQLQFHAPGVELIQMVNGGKKRFFPLARQIPTRARLESWR